jgi:hypothetical protein
MKLQAHNDLPPYTGELQVIEIVETNEPVGLQPLDCGNDFDNARGNFNDLAPQHQDFSALASKSGKCFFEFFGRN